MGKPSAPAPPDPRQTAAAQTGTNVDTAIANAIFNSTNQETPYGTLTYDIQPDGYSWTNDYTGETYSLPSISSRVELTPQQQATLDASQAAQGDLANLAQDRASFLRDYLPQTEALTNQIGERLYDMGAQRLDPRFAREEEALRTRLANQGIAAGSEAYNREMEGFGQTKNDAYNQLMLQGRGQALSEINTPINQITALLSGSQVSNPNVSISQPGRMPTTDVAGIINNNYAQQMGAYNAQQGQRNSMLGGLFGAGATLLGAPAGSVFGGLF